SLPETYFALFGAETAGIGNPLNFLLSPEQIADLLRIAATKVLVALGPTAGFDIWEKVEAVRGQLPGVKILSAEEFATLLERQPCDRLIGVAPPTADRIAAYYHTGGTTGSPKLAQHTHANQCYTAWVIPQMFDLGRDDAILNGLPLFHVAGSLDFGLAAFASGGTVVLPTATGLRNPAVIANHWRILERHEITWIGGVPTSMAALLNVPVGDADISAFKFACSGGQALPSETAIEFERRFKRPIRQVFGMTECAGITTIVPRHAGNKIGSAGLRLPFEQIAMAKLDGEGGIAGFCQPGENGVLAIKGPHVSPGYLDARHDKGTFAGDGWLISGDLGHIGEDGWLFITGRSKDLIIRSGHNIDPALIEEAASTHPAVLLSAAIGMPDEYAGELPVLFVTLRPERTVSEVALLAHLAQTIAERPALPKAVHVIEAMPVTGVGKIFKPALRWRVIEQVFRDRLRDATEGLPVAVSVGERPGAGVVASVSIGNAPPQSRSELCRKIAAILGRFAVRHEIVWR
ncbi:MAG: acyl-CoA synthetase, partial [Alphaproteobacteria bacterium]|nr:acyl-CoA synthetase [Alphaproteobacteria bacterium]